MDVHPGCVLDLFWYTWNSEKLQHAVKKNNKLHEWEVTDNVFAFYFIITVGTKAECWGPNREDQLLIQPQWDSPWPGELLGQVDNTIKTRWQHTGAQPGSSEMSF